MCTTQRPTTVRGQPTSQDHPHQVYLHQQRQRAPSTSVPTAARFFPADDPWGSTSGTSTLRRPAGTEQRQQPTPPLAYGHQRSMHCSWMRWSDSGPHPTQTLLGQSAPSPPSRWQTTSGYSYVIIPTGCPTTRHLLPADSQLLMRTMRWRTHHRPSLPWTQMIHPALPPHLMTRPTLPHHQPMRLLLGAPPWMMCHPLNRTSSRLLLLEALMLAHHTRMRVLPPPGPHHHHDYPETRSSCQLSSELPWPGLMHY